VRVVVAIPARMGSTRLPGKALAEIGGEPMVVRVWRCCLRAPGVDRVVVATDDERIRGALRAAGGDAILTSPAHTSGTDRIAEAVRGVPCDLVVNVQGDEPFLEPALIGEVAAAAGEAGVEAATAATPVRRAGDLYDPSVVKVLVGQDGNAVYFSRFAVPFRAELWDTGAGGWRPRAPLEPPPAGYLRHIGIYAYRRGFLQRFTSLAPTPGEQAEHLEQLRILEHGHRIRVVTTAWEPLSVDTPEDLERARRRAEADRP
jgi:3-deoxy-manno-octulosonate cytidylyltransferase (CMP-KDO synthetase)